MKKEVGAGWIGEGRGSASLGEKSFGSVRAVVESIGEVNEGVNKGYGGQ